MAIDFEALREKAAARDEAARNENGGKIIDPDYQKKKVANDKKQAQKKLAEARTPLVTNRERTETARTSNKAILNTVGKAIAKPETTLTPNQSYLTLSNGQKVIVQKGADVPQTVDWNKVKASNFGKAYTGVGVGLVNEFTGLPSAVTGKDVSEKLGLTLKNDKGFQESGIKDTSAYKGGELGGELLGYVIQSGVANPATSKVGNAIGKSQLKKDIATNAVDAATVGLAQNIGIGYQQGLRDDELVADVIGNTLLDLGLGAGISLVGAGAKKVADLVDARKTKTVDLPTTKPLTEEVVEPATKQAETVDLGGKKAAVTTKRSVKKPTSDGNTYRILAKDNDGIFRTQEVRAQTENEAVRKLLEQGYEVSRKSQRNIKNVSDNLKEGNVEYIANAKSKFTGKTEKIKVRGNSVQEATQKLTDNGFELEGKLKVAGGGLNTYKVNAKNLQTGRYEKFEVKADSKADVPSKLTGYEITPKNIKQVELPQTKSLIKPNRKLKTNGVPEVHEKVNGFDVESSNIGQAFPDVKVGIVNPDLKYVGDALQNAEGLFAKFYKYAVSGQAGLERLSKAAGSTKVDDYTQAVRAGRGTVTHIFHNNMVDTAGKVVDTKSYKKLIDEIPKNVREDFNTYAQHLHNIDRTREGVPVFEQFSAAESQKIVDDMLKAHPEFAQYTKNINEWWNKFTKTWLLDTGRITQESYDAMLKKYPNYIPTYRTGKEMFGMGGSADRISVGSGVKKAKGGTSDVIPLEDNFLAQIDRIVTSSKKNDLYASIIEALRKDPEGLKAYGVLADNKQVLDDTSLDAFLTDLEEEGLKQVKGGRYMVTAYVDGKPVSAYINEDVADALQLLNNAYGWKGMRSFGELGRKLTNPIKAGITAYNPLFILSNISRDLPTLLIQSEHSVGKTLTGLGKAAMAMAKNDEIFQTYKAIGGKQGGYYAQGKGFDDALNEKGMKRIWSNIKNALSVIGEGTETIPRLAEFINSVEKYGDSKDGIMRALKDASDVTVNFARSAPLTKTADSWILYLNAAMQGLDKFARTAKKAPLKTLGRSAAVITVPFAMLTAYNWDNPHYQDLNERTKQNYFCIPNIMGEKDAEGNPMTFIKLPLNREYGALFGSSLDIIYGMMDGQTWEEATKGFKDTLATNFTPPGMEDNVFAAFKHIQENKNYAGQKIVPTNLEKADSKYQQDVTTSGAAKGIAGAANKIQENLGIPLGKTLTSPMKVDYLIDQYGGYLGSVAQGLTGKDVSDAKTAVEGAFVDPFKQRFTADARYSSGVVSDFYDSKEKNETEVANLKQEDSGWGEANAKARVYNSIADQLSEISKQEKEILASNMSKEQKNAKIKELRTQRNEIARSANGKVDAAAREFKQTPTFSQLKSNIKEKYNPNSGISKEKWGKAYNAQVNEDKFPVKVMKMAENGVTSYEQAVSFNSKISETAFKEGMALKEAGITSSQIKKAYVDANYNKSEDISKDEAMRYLDGTNYSLAQKAAIFDALMKNPKTKNPYRG